MNQSDRRRTAVVIAPGGTNTAGIVTPLTTRGLHGQLLETLGMSIAAGDIRIGEQIIPESIALDFNVSRTVVREVLKVLETKGMVAARPRTGTRVRPQAEWAVLDPDVIRWRSTGPDSARQLSELLDMRGAIEPLAARTASQAATPTDIQSLFDALESMSNAVQDEDWAAFTEADVSFHRALLSASGSLVVRQLSDPIEAALRVRRKLRLLPSKPSESVVASHYEIFNAILRHDGAAAESASRRIVDVAGAEVLNSGHGRQTGSARSDDAATR